MPGTGTGSTPALRALEGQLAEDAATGTFCHGDVPTMADVCLVPQLANARRAKIPLDGYPTLLRIDGKLPGAGCLRPRRARSPAGCAIRAREPCDSLRFHWRNRADDEIRDSRPGHPFRAGRRQRSSSFRSAISIAWVATMPNTPRRWAETRRKSRRSFSPSRPTRSSRWCRPRSPRCIPAGDQELPSRNRAGRRDRRSGASIAPEHAEALIYGYAVGLDMTRRDLQNAMREIKRPWDIGKSFAQAAPIGPIHRVAGDIKLADAQKTQADLLRKQRELDDAKRELELTVEKRVQTDLATCAREGKKRSRREMKLKVMEAEQTIALDAATDRRSKTARRTRVTATSRRGSRTRTRGAACGKDSRATRSSRYPKANSAATSCIGSSVRLGQPVRHNSLGIETNQELERRLVTEAPRRPTQRQSRDRRHRQSSPAERRGNLWPSTTTFGSPTPLALPVAIALRQTLIENRRARAKPSEGQQTKMEMVYQYLTGPRFRQRRTSDRRGFFLHARRSRSREKSDHEAMGQTRRANRPRHAGHRRYVRRPSRHRRQNAAGNRRTGIPGTAGFQRR